MKQTSARVVVLISGRGSNLQAIAAASRNGAPYQIVGTISNRPAAAGLELARQNGIPTAVLDHKGFDSRLDFDRRLAQLIDGMRPDFIALAGFMRVLSAEFTNRYAGRLINIHPSLLPKFPGLNTHARALEAGETEHGVSVHFVTGELDGGPVIERAVVNVLADDTEQSLAARVLEQEHLIYPRVLTILAEGRITLTRAGVIVKQQAPIPRHEG